MENLPQVLKDIGVKANAEVVFGYVMADGTYVTMRGIVVSLGGSPERGITGIKIRYTGQHTHLFTKWRGDDGRYIVPCSLAGIEAGQTERARRNAEKDRAELAAYRAANPATPDAVAYLERLYQEAEEDIPTDLKELSRVEASERIDRMLDRLAPKRAAEGRCQGCGRDLGPDVDHDPESDRARARREYCHRCI